MDLRIATCRPLPEPDADEAILLDALRARGVRPRMAAWNDPAERWDEPVPTVIRSTWDYIHDLLAFRAWIDRVERAAPLWNPAAVVRGNLHKGYLLELHARGVPIVPTALVRRADDETLRGVLDRNGWTEIVVKPAVGAASYGTLRFGADELPAAHAHMEHLRRTCGDVLVQPYVRSVEGHGERALVWIDGEFTHAVRKSPRFGDDVESVSPALPIEDDERALATRALAAAGAEMLYARVDVARDQSGCPRVMELELVEPSLFLTQSPIALERLAEGIARRLR